MIIFCEIKFKDLPFKDDNASISFPGGGESPKSVSGKVLVAAYWLFVVLMVSTFTSNLAAFLTVERMQATGEGGVKNLDMLADQSRIGYTLLKHSSVHQYFKNMAGAENELYGYCFDIYFEKVAFITYYEVFNNFVYEPLPKYYSTT